MLTSCLSKLPVSSLMGILIASSSALYLCKHWLLSKHRIPGPPRLPIVGSLPFLVGDIREVLAKMKKKYGDIFVLFVGSECIVVLNGYDTIKEALLQKEGLFDGRSQKHFRELTKNLGVASSQGDIWQEQRRFVLKSLRNFGFGRRGMEDYISEEAAYLKKLLASVRPETPCDIYHFIIRATCNVICTVVNGRRYDYSDPEFTECVDLSKEFLSYIGINNPVFVFPLLKFIPGDLFGYKKALSISNRLRGLYKEWIIKHRLQLSSGEETADLIGEYLREMDKCKEQNEYFFDDQLAQIIMDLFLAGTDTTANTLAFAILHLIIDLDIQHKVQEEIDHVIGSHRKPTYADRFQMPYTRAVLSEVQRITDVAPLALPHAAMDDATLRGYNIAKGTTVIINLHSVLWDEEIFPDPEKFKPERFLDDKGSFVSSEACLPFSLGKRACLAESMATAELFLLFTHLLQNFTFRLPPNQLNPDTYGVVGLTVQPKPFCVVVENRLV